MYGETSKYYDFGKYNDRKDEVKQLLKEIKDPSIPYDASRHKGISALSKHLNTIEKQLKNLRKKLREVKDIDNYVERTVRTQELKDKQRSLVMKFNSTYDRLRNNE
jgi:predicted translin family RNA/ssDNA-binding protein